MYKNILILEDHVVQLKRLSHIVSGVDDEIQVFGVQTVAEALEVVFSRRINVFIVDIVLTEEAGDVSGLKFVEKLRSMDEYLFTPVIFTTTLEDPQMFAYKKLNCIDYVEKPYEEQKIRKVVKRCLLFPGKQRTTTQVIFRQEGILWAINISEILYIEILNHHVYVHCVNGKSSKFPYRTLKNITQELGESPLIQCSRSLLVNLDFVRNIDVVNGFIELTRCNNKLNIGSTYKKKLKEIYETKNNPVEKRHISV